MSWIEILPLIFMALLGFSLFVYVVLDGFDLGVGMLMLLTSAKEQDHMVASIGPFWDANETWLVLGVGILLIAFPKAHGLIFTLLYLPVMFMLLGLILRGVAFDFRVKARDYHRQWWNTAFIIGSFLATLMQGWMLGRYVTGFAIGPTYVFFALAIAFSVMATYALLGACWLLIKTEGMLQQQALSWAKWLWIPVVVGMILISIATPLVSQTVFERWFTLPAMIGLMPIPLATMAALVALRWSLTLERILAQFCWLPFTLLIGALLMGAFGLAYSLYPYVVIDRLTIWEAASSHEALQFTFIGVVITIPAIIGYTIFSYRVFKGKVSTLKY